MRSRLLIASLLVCTVLAIAYCFHPVPGATADEKPDIIAPEDKTTCLACHAEKVDAKHLEQSAHGKLNCQDCHRGVNQYPHPPKAIAQHPSCRTCHSKEAAALSHSIHNHGDAKRGSPPDCQTCHSANAHEVSKLLPLAPKLRDAACRTCHRDVATALTSSVHGHGKQKNGPGCLSCHGDNPHAISAPTKIMGAQSDASCRRCHRDVSQALMLSVHGHDSKKVPGTRPGCLACHGNNPHAISTPAKAAEKQTATMCIKCHGDIAKKMDASAHGHAGSTPGLRLNCYSCHGSSLHTVKDPTKMSATQKSALCESCHADVAKSLAVSAHGHPGAAAGKRPNCLSCHGEDLHAIAPRSQLVKHRFDTSCKQCHADMTKMLAKSVHGDGNLRFTKESGCLACHGGSAHNVLPLARLDRAQQESACKTCHSSLSQTLKNSVHDRPDKQPGDHPTCLYCHGKTPHGITPPRHLSPKQRAELCGTCHSDAARMARYGLTTAAFDSYKQTFHGKALLRFNKTNAANCTDCHGLHGVLAPDNPDAPTNPRHVAATCANCHKGAKLSFALSGANHLRMRIASSPVLRLEEMLFRLLVFGSMAFLMGMVMLDLRRKVFCRDSVPECGRFIALLIAISFFALIGGIVLALLQVPHAWICWLSAILLMVLAMVINHFQRRGHAHHREKLYHRFTVVQRTQHILLASSFTVLVLTGFPLRFADVGWTHYSLMLFGGFDGARIAHRVAGVTMILNWVWHLGFLLYRWKKTSFKFEAWTMWPRVKDVTDLFDTVKYGLGLRKDPPQFERFQFREKFDYFADIWGTIVMGASGLILWFPTAIGNWLPDLAFGMSYIAHSYEGLLAMMAIIVWHFYNAHFNPDMFPMNPAWLTGKLTESEMAREHALEKARLDAEAEQAPKPKIPSTR